MRLVWTILKVLPRPIFKRNETVYSILLLNRLLNTDVESLLFFNLNRMLWYFSLSLSANPTSMSKLHFFKYNSLDFTSLWYNLLSKMFEYSSWEKACWKRKSYVFFMIEKKLPRYWRYFIVTNAIIAITSVSVKFYSQLPRNIIYRYSCTIPLPSYK